MSRRLQQGLLLLGITLVVTGCGLLADPDRIVVAKLNDRVIRRADLNDLLRNMLPEERPLIATRGDLLRVLESYLDQIVKEKLAESFQREGTISVPWELAANEFDARFPKYRFSIENAEQMGMSEAEKAYFEQERDLRIDQIHKKLLGEAGVWYRINQEIKNGTLAIKEEEFEEEYKYRKDTLRHSETIHFEGIVIPLAQEEASTLAANICERLKAGEAIHDVAGEVLASGKGFPLNSALKNEPTSGYKFASFWEQAAGAQQGDVLEPIVIRGWEMVQSGPEGRTKTTLIPDAYLVSKVIEVVPERPKTLEEAREDLARSICYARMIKQLREENGVEIYEDNLADPAAYTSSEPQSIFDER